jgi:hypothetical protein
LLLYPSGNDGIPVLLQLLVSHRPVRIALDHLDDVPAKLRLYRRADLARLEPQRRFLEWRNHLAAREPAQVA